jgi:TonB-dependent SusC/RagA subfamily outer membrane receptor
MLYLPYMLMLRRESFFRFNRMMLLGILFLSLVLPLCNISGMSLDRQPVVQAAQLQILELGIPIHVLPEVQVVADGTVKYGTTGFSVFLLVSILYIVGMMILLAIRLWQVGRLQFGLRKGTLWQQEENGVRIYCHADDVNPFSWMRNIVISQKDYDEAGREIVLHEMGHIQAHHSWDVVLLTLVQMLQWWNPLVYVLGISLRDVHEYEADDYVLRQGISAQSYQLLIIKKAVGSGSYAFANSFNHSLTKKRITMMKNSNSNPWMRSKALYVIPVAALALSAFATPKFVAPIKDAVTKLEGKSTENSPNLQDFLEEKEEITVKDVSGKATASVDEVQDAAQPLIVLNGKIFDIPKDAIPSKRINFEEQLTKLLNIDVEDVESITVLQKEAAIAVWGEKGANGVIDITTKDANDLKENQPDDKIFDKPEVLPQFPGGEAELYGWLARNVKYPSEAIEYGVQGRIFVQFVVEKDGGISDIKISKVSDGRAIVVVAKAKDDSPEELNKENEEKGLKALQDESIRLVKAMPKWKPGTNKGKPVRCYFHLPINFRLH